MRFGRRSWLTLGILILIAASVTLYMLYRGQVTEQGKLDVSLAKVNTTMELSGIQIRALEKELAQLESDIARAEGETSQLADEITQKQAELARLEAERAQAVAQALLLLDEAGAKFISSVESIEYNGILFDFARNAGLEVEGLNASEPGIEEVEGISYTTTSFSISVRGGVDEILDFVKTVVADEAFKTAIVETFTMAVPEPLTDEGKQDIEGEIRSELIAKAKAEAEAKLTVEDRVGFWVEAIEEVTGIGIEPRTVEAITAAIKEKIAGLVDDDIELPGKLAAWIEDEIEKAIKGTILDEILEPMADEIAALIVKMEGEGYNYDDLVELLGEDIAELLGEDIAGLLPDKIADMLKDYIEELAGEKESGSVADMVEGRMTEIDELAEKLAAEKVEELETSSADIALIIYTYEGE
jgi:hypothetical protein